MQGLKTVAKTETYQLKLLFPSNIDITLNVISFWVWPFFTLQREYTELLTVLMILPGRKRKEYFLRYTVKNMKLKGIFREKVLSSILLPLNAY